MVTSIVAVPVVFAHSAFYADKGTFDYYVAMTSLLIASLIFKIQILKANTEIFFLSLIGMVLNLNYRGLLITLHHGGPREIDNIAPMFDL